MKLSEIFGNSNIILFHGNHRADVTIQIQVDQEYLHQPKYGHSRNLLVLLNSGEEADILFNLGGNVFLAHRVIACVNAPILANCSDGIIMDTSPEVLQILLEHIYSGREATKEVLCHSR